MTSTVKTVYLDEGPNSFIYINGLRYRAKDVALAIKALPATTAAMTMMKDLHEDVLKDAAKIMRALLRHGYDWERSDASIMARDKAKQFIKASKKVLP